MSVNSQTLQIFEQAAKLNAHGIHFLRCNDARNAHQSFTQALRLLGQLTIIQEGGVAGDNDKDSSNSSSAPPLFCSAVALTPKNTVSSNDGSSVSSFYFYDNALAFAPPPPTTTQGPSHETIAFAVAVTIFNTALVYHRQGGDSYVAKALTLYQKCAGIAQSYEKDTTNEDDGSLPGSQKILEQIQILHLLALNNHAGILAIQGNVTEALQEIESIRSMLPYFQEVLAGRDGGEGDDSFSHTMFLTIAIFEELMLNVSVPGITIVALAA